jgi:hypothetical protein
MLIWSNESRELFKNVVIENNIGTLSLPSENPFNIEWSNQCKILDNNQSTPANEYKQYNLQLNNGKIATGVFIKQIEFFGDKDKKIFTFVIDTIS